MKKIFYLFIALLFLGCSEKQEASSTPILFASIPPIEGLAEKIAGDHFVIHTLVAEGQSPHTYEPTARQLSRLGQAQAFLAVGLPFEKQLLKKIEPLYPNLILVPTQAGIAQQPLTHAHDAHDHSELDPHVWLSPTHAIILVKNITQALQKLDPDHADDYQKNSEQLIEQFQQLDAQIRTQLAPFAGSRFYVFHPSFGYFAAAYGLEQIAIELDGKAPSPRQLATLIEQAQADHVKIIFVQKQFPSDSAKAIANAIGGRVVPLDPLAKDLVSNLRLMAESIRQALKK